MLRQKPLPVKVEARDKEGKIALRNFVEEDFKGLVKKAKDAKGAEKNLLDKKVAQWKAWLEDAGVKANEHGYQDFKLALRQVEAGPRRLIGRLDQGLSGLRGKGGATGVGRANGFHEFIR